MLGEFRIGVVDAAKRPNDRRGLAVERQPLSVVTGLDGGDDSPECRNALTFDGALAQIVGDEARIGWKGCQPLVRRTKPATASTERRKRVGCWGGLTDQ